jgi:hypothetical protein
MGKLKFTAAIKINCIETACQFTHIFSPTHLTLSALTTLWHKEKQKITEMHLLSFEHFFPFLVIQKLS